MDDESIRTPSRKAMCRLCLLLLRHSEKPVQEDCHGRVERNIHPQQTEIHPPLRVIRAERGKELICLAILAIAAALIDAHYVGIEKGAPISIEIALHILGASLILRRRESEEFVTGAMHRGTSKTG